MRSLQWYKRGAAYFQPLFTSEEQEFLYTGGKKGQQIEMATRLMYFDLLWMRQ